MIEENLSSEELNEIEKQAREYANKINRQNEPYYEKDNYLRTPTGEIVRDADGNPAELKVDMTKIQLESAIYSLEKIVKIKKDEEKSLEEEVRILSKSLDKLIEYHKLLNK